MPSPRGVLTANTSLASHLKSPTGVFVGATSGIGLSTISALLSHTHSPKLYIVERSQANFAATLAALQEVNSSSQLVFIEAQVSLLKEVERVCDLIRRQESALDLLWVSQGGLSLGYEGTVEGIIGNYAIMQYSRTLFMYSLLPLLGESADGRIVSVSAAGEEGAVNMSDIGLSEAANYGFVAALRQGVTMMSLVMRELSLENPNVSLIHTDPGVVNTAVHVKLAETMTGYLTPLSWLVRWGLVPLVWLLGRTAEEAGQVGLYELTSERYSADSGENFFRLRANAEDAGASSILSTYIEDGTQRKVWEHTMGVYEKVLAQ
ncbi:Oxidoreductase [Lachnellula subtilissima]|uniref:Oxidoreductase n=1 Tax=Lachnellula subtilissima TaxID=602034 RepID=A0A8H8U9C0_9HELO|nr:Oxidoreductase [Lachnellula subtilissima]